jgi:hypothetical protein
VFCKVDGVARRTLNPTYTPVGCVGVSGREQILKSSRFSALNLPVQHAHRHTHTHARTRTRPARIPPPLPTQVTIVNFAVKEQGLEAQLLNTVVKCERPDLDRQKNDLVVKVAAGKRTQVRSWTET